MKNNKKKTIIAISIITGILILITGITYAIFTYQQTGNSNNQLVLGDIYMHYQETNQLKLENAMPGKAFKTLKIPEIEEGYNINPIIKEQNLSDNELTRCVEFFIGTGLTLDNGSTIENFCKGTGTAEGKTFEEHLLDETFLNNLTSKGYNDLIVSGGGTYLVNPIMKTQSVQDTNKLTKCVSILTVFEFNFDEGSTFESYCQGTGTAEGKTFEEDLNNGLAGVLSNFGYSDLFIEEDGVYKPNPVMATQSVEDTNELTACTIFYASAPFDEGSTVESFCKGTGTFDGITIQENIDNWSQDEYFLVDGGQSLLDNGIILYNGIYVPNENMTNQSLNELGSCVNIFTNRKYEYEEGKTAIEYCQGSGRREGLTIQEDIDKEYETSVNYLESGGQELLDANVIVNKVLPSKTYSYETFEVNPNMTEEVLNSCKIVVERLEYSFDTGNDATTFCQGTGTSNGKTLADMLNEWKLDNYTYLTEEGNILLRKNIIIPKINTPYFEFTITGKNTYTKEDIWYDIILTHGDNHETRNTRIKDELLRFTLTEVDSSGGETTIVDNMILYDIANGKRLYVETIPKNTMSEINKTYRLYMNISESTVICGGEVSDACDYYTDKSPNWNDVFASVKVNVTGDFNEKEKYPVGENLSSFYRNYVLKNETSTIKTDEDGTIYMVGVLQENASGEIDFDGERVDYNFVWYSGKLWRITAINPDGTLKMITEDVVTTISFGDDSDYENSYVREWLNQEFLPTLYNYQNLIKMDSVWNITRTSDYIPENLSNGKAIPKLEKTTTIIDPIGLLNTYEYVISYKNIPGTTSHAEDSSDYYGYLNVAYSWWLLNSFDDKNVNFVQYYSGARVQSLSPTNFSGVRPVVNLLSSVKISGGTGSEADPYRIIGDKEDVQANTTLLNTRSSGEYVKIENDTIANRLFRIINAETIDGKLTTKLITNDYVKDTSDLDSDNDKTERLKMQYANSQVLWSEIDETDENYWKGYLNNTWLKELDPTFNQATGESNILAKGIYYLDFNNYYKSTVCKNVSSDVTIAECVNNGNMIENTWQGYVGLPRYGELFASQPKDYVFRYHEDIDATPGSPARFYIISSDSSNNYIIDYYSLSGASIASAARPTINLKSEIVIKSGSGTEQDPFVVGLPS